MGPLRVPAVRSRVPPARKPLTGPPWFMEQPNPGSDESLNEIGMRPNLLYTTDETPPMPMPYDPGFLDRMAAFEQAGPQATQQSVPAEIPAPAPPRGPGFGATLKGSIPRILEAGIAGAATPNIASGGPTDIFRAMQAGGQAVEARDLATYNMQRQREQDRIAASRAVAEEQNQRAQALWHLQQAGAGPTPPNTEEGMLVRTLSDPNATPEAKAQAQQRLNEIHAKSVRPPGPPRTEEAMLVDALMNPNSTPEAKEGARTRLDLLNRSKTTPKPLTGEALQVDLIEKRIAAENPALTPEEVRNAAIPEYLKMRDAKLAGIKAGTQAATVGGALAGARIPGVRLDAEKKKLDLQAKQDADKAIADAEQRGFGPEVAETNVVNGDYYKEWPEERKAAALAEIRRRQGKTVKTTTPGAQALEAGLAAQRKAAAGGVQPTPAAVPRPAGVPQRIRIRMKDGRTGTILASDFDPNTMTRLQ